MRALIQRVTAASVTVDHRTISAIENGLLILICAMDGDTTVNADKLAAKISKLRIFKDGTGKMNRSLIDVEGSALIVSQFTLAADTSRGNRPGFSTAAAPDQGRALYEYFIQQIASHNIPVQTGAFGADMSVALLNDGPVTISMEI